MEVHLAGWTAGLGGTHLTRQWSLARDEAQLAVPLQALSKYCEAIAHHDSLANLVSSPLHFLHVNECGRTESVRRLDPCAAISAAAATVPAAVAVLAAATEAVSLAADLAGEAAGVRAVAVPDPADAGRMVKANLAVGDSVAMAAAVANPLAASPIHSRSPREMAAVLVHSCLVPAIE